MGELAATLDVKSRSDSVLLGKITTLEKDKQSLLQQVLEQKRMIVSYERKLTNYDTIKEQRDWLLEEMTKKIGELSHFQSELFKAERLSAIGEMSARIAHDMRNPLAIIKNTIELVKIKHATKIQPDLFNLFTTIDNASSRLIFQLDDVLNFVRTSPLSADNLSLSTILSSALQELVVPDKITIHRPTNDVYLYCDGEKIEAVFTNLIMNAIQAMENEGDVIIRFGESQDHISFQVQDSGPGIPENVLPKIFEPLFTTKSRGTGLGLPAVKTIILQHQGNITVSNDPTVFSVTIPKHSV